VADGGDVGGAAGFQGDVDDGFAEADAVVGAVVDGFDDVGALAGEDLGEVQESAGAVLQINADTQKPAIFYQAALDDFGKKGDVDVAAADHNDSATVTEVGLGLDDGGERGGSGTFGQGFFLLEEHEDGAGDFLVIDGDDLVDVAGNEREGDVSGAADSDAVGDGCFSVDGDGSAGFACAKHRRQALGLNTDDADFWVGLFESARDSADKAAAADGDDDSFNVGDLFEEFEADGSLTADDHGIVEWMDEGAAFFDAAAESLITGFVVTFSEEDDFGSVCAGGGDLDLRRGEGHDDLRADATRGCMEGYALSVIAGAGGDDSALAFGFAQREELVEGAALFKGSGALKVLELQMNGEAGEFRKMMRELARGDMNGVFDAGARGLNADKRYGFQDKLLVKEKVTENAKTTSRVCGWWPEYCWTSGSGSSGFSRAHDVAANSNGGNGHESARRRDNDCATGDREEADVVHGVECSRAEVRRRRQAITEPCDSGAKDSCSAFFWRVILLRANWK